MKIPSIAQASNIIAQTVGNGILGYWSIVDSRTQELIAQFDSFYKFGYNQTNDIASYPIENGSFATYNKQSNPFDTTVSLIKSGLTLPYSKQRFIEDLEEYSKRPLPVDIITPMKTYINCSLSGLSFEFDPEDNSDMVIVNLPIKQIQYLNAEAGGQTKTLNARSRLLQGLKSALSI